jgi:cell division septation protein DedD
MWCTIAPTRRLIRASVVRSLLAVPFIAGTAALAHAQSPDRAARPATADSVFARARQLVVAGNGTAGRALVDSMVAAAQPETPAYADALFWRASLAATGTDAERDYRKIVIEYPMSQHAGQALLQLAQLEAARGDRAAATPHLQRFLLENPNSPDAGRAGLLFVRLSFEANEVRPACSALPRALAAVPAADVELRNQLDYYSPRCTGVDTTTPRPRAVVPAAQPVHAPAPKPAAAAPAPTSRPSAVHTPPAHALPIHTPTPRGPAAHAPTAHAPAAPAPRATGRFTVQVAAYTTRAEADRLARALKARGIDARVAGSARLFRVRVGRYATRTAATEAAKNLKARNVKGFVTEMGAGDK